MFGEKCAGQTSKIEALRDYLPDEVQGFGIGSRPMFRREETEHEWSVARCRQVHRSRYVQDLIVDDVTVVQRSNHRVG